MVSIIRYVTGLPKEKVLEPKKFDEVKRKYSLDKENIDVWQYSGPLRKEDFDSLKEIFCSDQFREFKGDKNKFLDRLKVAIKGEQPLTKTGYSGKIGHPSANKHITNLKEISEVSDEFFGELEKTIQKIGMPTCANDALDFVQRNAKNNGLFVPISYSYPKNGIQDLSYNTEALVFIDERFRGKIGLNKTREYNDQWAGDTEEGKIMINILGQKKEEDWNSWQNNSLRWIVDPIIRKQILGEEEGISFTRL